MSFVLLCEQVAHNVVSEPAKVVFARRAPDHLTPKATTQPILTKAYQSMIDKCKYKIEDW